MTNPLSRASVLDLLEQLIRTPSVNPTLAPDEGHDEGRIAVLARDWFGGHGIQAWLEEAAPGRPNMVARVGSGAGPVLIFCAHLDTVATSGMTIPPFEPRLENGRVYGRGSYDMKGGAAAVMSAAAELARGTCAGTLLVALVADEEYASVGAQDFVRRYKSDAAVLTEPSEGRLILGHKGFVWVEITTRGRAAHGSRWDLGVSAIGKMGRIIAALEQFDREVLRLRVNPLLGPASQHCALIAGGSGLSTYSEQCTLKIERRTLPGETTQQVLQELETAVHRAGEDAEICCLLDRPPLTCPEDSEIVHCLTKACESVTGKAPEAAGVGYWMDAALFAAAGIPTINYGASGAGAHEAVEWVDLESVVSCASVLAETARQFFAGRGVATEPQRHKESY